MTEIEYLRFYLERKIKLDEENLKLDTDLLEALKLEEQAREQERVGEQNKSDNEGYDNLPETFSHERAAELDNLPWRDGKKSGSFIHEQDSPVWLLNILKSLKRSYRFAGYDYKLSVTKPNEQYAESRSFVWRYHTK